MKTHITLILLIIGMMFSSGCVTDWAINDYGNMHKRFKPTGPTYGDATRVYTQGMEDLYTVPLSHAFRFRNRSRKSESRPAYRLIKINEGKIISVKLYKGSLPPTALAYPPIMPSNDIFSESRQYDFSTVYTQNPNDINEPYITRIDNYKDYRSTLSMIFYPVVLPAAVAADIIISPAYLIVALGIY